MVWEFQDHLPGSINNSVLLTSLSLTRSNESSVEPRVGISNNDGTIRLYDVPLRVQNSRRKLREVGIVLLDVPINHCEYSRCLIPFLLFFGFFSIFLLSFDSECWCLVLLTGMGESVMLELACFVSANPS
jgi:hypothetical protein